MGALGLLLAQGQEGTQRRARRMLHPLSTQHPKERKTCLPGGPSLHLDVSPSLDTLSFPSLPPLCSHTARPFQPKAPISQGTPTPTLTLGRAPCLSRRTPGTPSTNHPSLHEHRGHTAPGLEGGPFGARSTTASQVRTFQLQPRSSDHHLGNGNWGWS